MSASVEAPPRVLPPRIAAASGALGLTMIEVLVSLTIFGLVMGGLFALLIHNSQVNRETQMATMTQTNARHCLTMIEQVIRSAGWDPMNAGFTAIGLDSTPLDSEQSLEVRADLNADGDTDDPDEDVRIRRVGSQVEWRKSSDVSQPYIILADNITNDLDGDGTVEAMFIPDSLTDPHHITVHVTARSPLRDSRSGQYFRYTLTSDVALRKKLG